MAEKNQKNDISELGFEKAIQQLTAIVAGIEHGEIPLQQSIQQYEKGMALIKHCRTILTEAEKRVEKISEQPKE